MTDALRAIARSTVVRLLATMVVLAAAVLVVVDVTSGGPTYPLHAVYSSAPGLYPGAAVEVLGVRVGTVTGVTNVGDTVHVDMRVNSGTRIPSSATAALVSPQLLGSPDLDLSPGYTGGPSLAAGSTIPLSHTAVPVSTDQVLKEVQKALNALNPHAVGELVGNLAQDLDGQGATLNKLIQSAAGTIQLLADKGNDLGQLNGTLAQLTGTLDADSSQIEQLVSEYDTVSGVLASHSGQLNNALTQLTGASSALVGVLTPNVQSLEADVGTVTSVGRTLDRNISSVDEILQNGNSLFQGAARAYDSNYNWLNLNLATDPGVSGAVVTGMLRDRLAGICRRIVANHSAGLTASELASLQQCGNPASNFFDPILADIPSILDNLVLKDSASETGAQLLQQGLNQILAIEPSDGGTAYGSPGAGAPASGASPTTTTTTVPPTTTTTAPPNSSSQCGLLNAILGCTKKSTGSNSNSSTSSGLGGLLSQKVQQQAGSSNATLAAQSSSAPTLTAPAAGLLPPLHAQTHRSAHHRGLLAQWAHDVWSWL